MVNLQLLATAASLAAVIVLVKPLLTLGRPCFGSDVLAVTVTGWFFHGTKSKGAEAPSFPRRSQPYHPMKNHAMPKPAMVSTF